MHGPQKQIYTTQSIIQKISNQSNDSLPITFNISVYTDCIFIVINQTGSVGSIIRGQFVSRVPYNQFDMDQQSEQIPIDKAQIQSQKQGYVYEVKVLFGSTEIQFYELIVRKIMALIYEDENFKDSILTNKLKLIANISLQIKHKSFQQGLYYSIINQQIKRLLKEVL